MVAQYKAGTVNYAMMNETAKITDTNYVQLASALHLQLKTDEELYIWPERCHVRYITKKVDIYTWLPFVMQLKFYLLYTTQM